MKQITLLLCATLNSVALGAATTKTLTTSTVWPVPSGVNSIIVKTCGGNGFTKITSNLANYGGKGACVSGTLLVNPGDDVYFNVGIGAGKGSCTGTETNGVCNSENRNGGGYSEVKIGGVRMMVGGGGGGVGNGGPGSPGVRISNSANGGNAGYQNPTSGVYSGGAGTSYSATEGATPNTGGTGGGGGSATGGSAGGGTRRRRLRNEMALLAAAQAGSTDGTGGQGQSSSGGGGGGGYRGGGGGGLHSGGGGGSSYCLTGAGITCTGATQNDGTPYITYEYTAVNTATPSTSSPSTSAPSTSAPSTSAPSTSAPSTSAPSTSAPSTSAPSTSAPSTSAPTKVQVIITETGPFTIPVGVTHLLFEGAGAEGGQGNKGSSGGAPGKGAIVKVYTPVTPGDEYFAVIGKKGEDSQGKTSSANGGSGLNGGSGYNGGGGGGGTAISHGHTFDPATVFLVAGGGGGASQNSKGGAGGGGPVDGPFGGNGGGRYKGIGATASAGGAHGQRVYPGKMKGVCPVTPCLDNTDGSLGLGGSGGFQAQAGGGGGFYGGGGGGTWGGGGGGSSNCANGLSCDFTAGVHSGNGYVKLHY